MLPLTRILCPTDFSDASRGALAAARELALHFRAEIRLVHVVPVVPVVAPNPNFVLSVPEYERALHMEAQGRLDVLSRELNDAGVRSSTAIGHGDAGSEIVRMAKGDGVDIIVIATQGHGRLDHFLFGSVAERVVRLAECPVLTVRAK